MADENRNTSMSVQDCWKQMRKGIPVVKYHAHPSKMKKHEKKVLYLDSNMEAICYKPTKKSTRMEISNMATVQDSDQRVTITFIDESPPFVFEAKSQETTQHIVQGLQTLIRNKGDTGKEDNELREKWLIDAFEKFDKNKDGSLGLGEIQRLLIALNVQMSFKQLKTKFKEANEDGDKALDRREFAAFFKSISTRADIVDVMKRFSSSGSHMSLKDFQYFVASEQGMPDATMEYCVEMILAHEPTETGKDERQLGIDGLTSYLLSREGDIFTPEHDAVYQDMTLPMTDYFIASSHNTYLMADQLRGPSSVEAYENALTKGCRCVELDCWDGDNEEPVVYHGHTLTSKILFKDIITVVDKYAFEVSDYPVILSLENHCSVDQQKTMATHLVNILGDKLYKEPVDPGMPEFPSPDFFKNKILIKGKKLKPEQEADDDDGGDVTDEDEAAEIDADAAEAFGKEDAPGPSTPPPPEVSKPRKGGTLRRSFRAVGRVIATSKAKERDATDGKKKKLKLATDLSRLVNHVTSIHFKNFDHSRNHGKHHEMSSFGESKMVALVENQGDKFVNYNKRMLSRIYPGGGRVDSSNYNPQQAWNAGCQIVALNYQTNGEFMQLNQGRFRQNGRAGYVVKPQILRDPSATFNPRTTSKVHGVDKVPLVITVISGQQLPKPAGTSSKGEVIDPFVKVDIHGIPADNFSFKTKVVKNNGFNPIWNAKFEKTLLMAELAMIRFGVYDEDVGFDDFIGQCSLPFTSLRTGYRHVFLLDKKGAPLEHASLFVHVQVDDNKKPEKNQRNPASPSFSP